MVLSSKQRYSKLLYYYFLLFMQFSGLEKRKRNAKRGASDQEQEKAMDQAKDMQAPYEPPALEEAGLFTEVTLGKDWWGDDWYGQLY